MLRPLSSATFSQTNLDYMRIYTYLHPIDKIQDNKIINTCIQVKQAKTFLHLPHPSKNQIMFVSGYILYKHDSFYRGLIM